MDRQADDYTDRVKITEAMIDAAELELASFNEDFGSVRDWAESCVRAAIGAMADSPSFPSHR